MSELETAIAAQSVKTDQQKQILQEILITEEHYIEDLKILIEVRQREKVPKFKFRMVHDLLITETKIINVKLPNIII